jgi:N-glycosyltransferase
MRVLFTCPPGISHLNGTLTLAAGLRAAGHEVAYASAASFTGAVESAGFQAFAAGPDYDLSDPRTMPEIVTVSAHGGGIAVFAEIAGRGMVEDLVALIERWRPSLVIRNHVEFGAWIATELLGVPLAWLSPGALDLPAPLLASFTGNMLTRELPARYGLAPDPGLTRLYGYPYLNTMPAAVTPPGFPLPPRMLRYRDRAFGSVGEEGLPDWVSELGDRPLVHASLGTVFSATGEGKKLNELVLEALRDEPVDLVLAVGSGDDPANYLPQPPNVRVVRHIAAHRAFIGRCDVLVSHAGPGTALLAMAAGVPACFLPMHAEQPILAKRLADLGAGLIAGSGPDDKRPFPAIDPGQLSPEEVRADVRRLLSERSFAIAMTRLGRRGRAHPPVPEAVSWLERVADGAP